MSSFTDDWDVMSSAEYLYFPILTGWLVVMVPGRRWEVGGRKCDR